SLQILLSVCGLVLLIACSNVANLLLARGVARRGQTAVRLAVGATPRQIVVQAFTESVLLAIGGGIVGLVVAMAAARLLLLLAFQVQYRVEVNLNRPPATYTLPQVASLYRQLEDHLSRLPGVQGAGLALYNPLTDNWGELIMVAGHPPAKLNEESGASWDRVSANYLQNLGMPILRGRAFTTADNETTAPVAIVNEA